MTTFRAFALFAGLALSGAVNAGEAILARDARSRRAAWLAAATIALLAAPSAAHDPYDAFLTPFGTRCCGGEDCAPLAKGDVEKVRDGYFIRSRLELVPAADAQLGPDDEYHLCTYKGLRMCFLVPRAGV